ncbi:MAG: AI-2E family transporter [Lachnospiraceae bacterium]|nr:AI-2E family transporter [Lachnospiraceae bacterium]
MNLNRKNVRKIRGLILFTAAVILVLMKFDLLWNAAVFVVSILRPFILGGMIAFVINIPMRFFETKLFRGGTGRKGAGGILQRGKRGLSLVMAFLAVALVIMLVVVTVIPQLVATVRELTNKIPVFWNDAIKQLEVIFAENPELIKQLSSFETLEIDWKSVINTIIGFLQNGMGNVLNSTFTVASSIISSTVNFFIAVVFSIYILVQKEKLGDQCRRILKAYTSPAICGSVLKVAGLLHHNFSNFITGQCTEAVILGLMFVVSMTIFRFDYAVMVGVLIAFTALIPIVGAFIGCFVGAFLMMVDDPVKALWFVILFIVLQQVEGNLIYPHVVGNSVGLPSIWVLAAVTIGGSLMGVFGMLVFIPLLSTVYVLLREDVNRRNGAAVAVPEEKGSISTKKE